MLSVFRTLLLLVVAARLPRSPNSPQSPYEWCSFFPRARPPTPSRASCRIRFRNRSASRSWSRTRRAPTVRSPRTRSQNRRADGYTLLMATNSPMSAVRNAIDSAVRPVADFTPITDVGRYNLLHRDPSERAGKNAVGAHRLRARQPWKATTPPVTPRHRIVERVLRLAGADHWSQCRTREPQAIADSVAGRVQLMFASSTTAVRRYAKQAARAGDDACEKNLAARVPSISEAGMPQFSITSWGGPLRPGQAAARGGDRLNREFRRSHGTRRRPGARWSVRLRLEPFVARQLAAFVRNSSRAYRRTLQAAASSRSNRQSCAARGSGAWRAGACGDGTSAWCPRRFPPRDTTTPAGSRPRACSRCRALAGICAQDSYLVHQARAQHRVEADRCFCELAALGYEAAAF